MRYLKLLFLINLAPLFVIAQKYTISGYIKDEQSGEVLIGATVVNHRTSSGSIANTHGYYSLTLSEDSVSLTFSFVGYQRHVSKFYLRKDTVLNIGLNGAMLEELELIGSRTDVIHQSSRMSTFNVPLEQVTALPVLLGETDILKILQLTPGVQSGYEGSNGLYVRGGGPDQNLILLDGVPVYNASHLFGFFSIFNTNAINHVELTKGGFPARYGGRLSSVVDIHMKEGNNKAARAEGSIGLISSNITVEAPIEKETSSFILSARRTYLDVLARPRIRKQTGGDRGYYFYDLNFKMNYILNQRSRLHLSTYYGDDKGYAVEKTTFSDPDAKFSSTNRSGLTWGNAIVAARWNHVFNPRLFGNVTATYSRYRFSISRKYEEQKTSVDLSEDLFYGNVYTSGIRDWGAKIDFEFVQGDNHYLRFGVGGINHKFSPGVYTYRSSEINDYISGETSVESYELTAYVEDDWNISTSLKSNIGIHGSAFSVMGKIYHSIQPRISLRYLITEDLALKTSFSSMTQFIHLLTNAGIGLPTDLWVSSTRQIKPQQAEQIALGFAKTYLSMVEFSVEGYYKTMTNLIEYKDGASYLNTEGDWQDKVVTNGTGKSYGTEFLLQKKTGALTGWIGYTLSKAFRQFDDLNSGRKFPYKYDRRHDISLAVTQSFTNHRRLSAVWVFGTGNAISLPIATYEGASNNFDDRYFNGSNVITYGGRNSYRMKSYHRLDLSFSWIKKKSWGERKWTVGVYNAYNRLNPFFIDLGMNDKSQLRFVEYSLFPILPFATYTFKFL